MFYAASVDALKSVVTLTHSNTGLDKYIAELLWTE